MIFSQKNSKYTDSDITLVNEVLEAFIGRDKEYCRKKAEKEGFIFLDEWNHKMGFVKEDQNKYLILSLNFEESECQFYQIIIKKAGKKWSDGKIIDYNEVREMGIV